MPKLLSITESIAAGAKLAQVGAVSHYHAPFLHEIVREIPAKQIECGSFSAALDAAIGSEMGGLRSLVVSSLIGNPSYAAYLRLPLVIANISRPNISSVMHDHSDVMAVRDSGALIFMPESNLEIMETMLQAYRVCEDPKVMLPAIINIDMMNLSESITPPGDIYAKRFLPLQKMPFFGKKTAAYATPGEDHSEYIKQQHRAMKNAPPVIESISAVWKKNFKRELPLVEKYRTEDADLVLVMSGFQTPTAKSAVNTLRAQGKKVGIARIRVIRPWPHHEIDSTIRNAKKIAVLDQAVSIGAGGVLHRGIRHPNLSSYISLGKRLSERDFIEIFNKLEKSQKEETVWL